MKYSILFLDESNAIEVDINVNKYTSKSDLLDSLTLVMEVMVPNTNYREYVEAVMNELVRKEQKAGWNWYFRDPDIIINTNLKEM